jgi:hypothetical protein
MPGPAHSGLFYVERWDPGMGAAGTPQQVELGGFSTDMVLSRVIADNGSSLSGDARVTLTLQQAVSAAQYNVVDGVPDNSYLFDASVQGIELGVLLPAGAKLRMIVRHNAGGDNIQWLILWAVP